MQRSPVARAKTLARPGRSLTTCRWPSPDGLGVFPIAHLFARP